MSPQHLERSKEFLENRVFDFNGEVVGLPISFKYKIRLMNKREMIRVGERKLTQFVGIDITKLGTNGIFLKNMKSLGNSQLPFGIRHTIETRKIASDIISLVKNHKKGSKTYRLPEDITGKYFYDFDEGYDLSLDVEIKENRDLEKPFIVNAEYIDEDSQINVLILFKPQEFPNFLNELHYELNETIRHELEHYKQDIKGELPSKKSKSKINYYIQPHELQAQVAGFKRISKLKKVPFMDVARNWFQTHQYEHGLSQNQMTKVLSQLEDYYKSTR